MPFAADGMGESVKKVTYAGQSFVTTDRAAATLFEYVAAMDRYGAGEAIEIPFVDGSDAEATALLLVWAGSEVICVPHPSDGPDPYLDVSALRDRADRRLAFKRSEYSDEEPADEEAVAEAL